MEFNKKINGEEYGKEEWIAECKQYIAYCQKKLEILENIERTFTQPYNDIFNIAVNYSESLIYQGKELVYLLSLATDVGDILRTYFEKARQEIFYKIELNKKYIENADLYYKS